jgi:protease PrsW
MANESLYIILFAVVGGILPTLIWLWFWLKEDSKHPEPKRLVAATFIGGMIMVPVALFVEKSLAKNLNLNELISSGSPNKVPLTLGSMEILLEPLLGLFIAFFILVSIEELVKYVAAQGVAFPNRHFDEPIDAMVYMITAALGFASVENILFIINNLGELSDMSQTGFFLSSDLSKVIVSGNLRFLGANILHVVTSGLMGAFIGFSFYKPKYAKFWYFILGFLVATLLHTVFNFFIIIYSENIITVFALYWMTAIILIYMFERIKRFKPKI